MSNVYFSKVKTKLKQLIKEEEIVLPNGFLNNFLIFLSNACNYEEEEKKIRPRVLLGSDLQRFTKSVPNSYKLKIAEGKKSGNDLNKILKSILPFCNNGWIVYIDTNGMKKNVIEYGILKSFTGPQGLTYTEVIFLDEEAARSGLIDVEVLNKYEIKFKCLSQKELLVDFRLYDNKVKDTFIDVIKMAEDTVKDISDKTKNEVAHKVMLKLLKIASQKIHGTICVVVKEDLIFPNEILSDGIWLERSINLVSIAEDAIEEQNGPFLGEKYYSVSGLFIEMMNMDGITVINTKGEVLGYNAFLRSSNENNHNVTGGARKRAAQALMSTENPNIIGVYFQSQDGSATYKRRGIE